MLDTPGITQKLFKIKSHRISLSKRKHALRINNTITSSWEQKKNLLLWFLLLLNSWVKMARWTTFCPSNSYEFPWWLTMHFFYHTDEHVTNGLTLQSRCLKCDKIISKNLSLFWNEITNHLVQRQFFPHGKSTTGSSRRKDLSHGKSGLEKQ